MTVITLTTVGFGEILDLANVPGARPLTMFILLSGLGLATDIDSPERFRQLHV